jgi:flavin-dependent dehydrogenase
MERAYDADAVVVGAGPTGCALSLDLRRRGWRVLLLDKAAFPRDKPCGEGMMPSGVRRLAELGVDLSSFPSLEGIRYRLPDGSSAGGRFRAGPGRGVRRERLDAMLAELAQARTGVEVTGVSPAAGGVEVATASGGLRCRALVGCDGLRSPVRAMLGWDRAPGANRRHAVVGHLAAERQRQAEIVVTVLQGREVYSAPSGPDEMLVALLGPPGSLRAPGRSVEETYREAVEQAHPELAGAPLSARLWGAGPFRTSPQTVARGRVFLAGDAAGFIDPLTGDAMAAGLAGAAALAQFLTADLAHAAPRYRRWYAGQWRRRRLVTGLALTLTGSQGLAARALAGVSRRPAALDRLLEVNDGSRRLSQVAVADWAALAGLGG